MSAQTPKVSIYGFALITVLLNRRVTPVFALSRHFMPDSFQIWRPLRQALNPIHQDRF
jgi:hypothetical protein